MLFATYLCCYKPYLYASCAELLEELGDKGKGKRKADGSAIASPAIGKSSKFNN
jgi:hypothetical protein